MSDASSYNPADYPDGRGPRPPDVTVDPLEYVIIRDRELKELIDRAAEDFAKLETHAQRLEP